MKEDTLETSSKRKGQKMPSAKDLKPETEFLKCLVIGQPGTGKSEFASSFPTPGFVLDFDNGMLSYRGKDFDYETFLSGQQTTKGQGVAPVGWVKFEKDLIQLQADVLAGKYKTVIVDSTTTMSDLAMERALQLNPQRSDTQGPVWNIHYSLVRNLMEGRLRQIIGMNCNVVVNAHVETVKDDKTGAIIDVGPLLPGALTTKLPGYFDEVYYSTIKTSTTKAEAGKPGQSITQFLLQTCPKGYYRARSRISGRERIIPEFVENNYSAIMEHVRKAG
jgi:hypothetical protein